VIAKRTDMPYEPGVRAKHWLKLKVEHRQEFVVGGYTEPRNTRQHLGALLLGYHDRDGRLVYAGHAGGGFTRAGLAEMARRLAPLERKTSPFAEPVRTNEPAHWVRPEVVVEVKFAEWTSDGKLRQPIYLGTRDDKDPREVTREGESVQKRAAKKGVKKAAKKAAVGRSATKKSAAGKSAMRKSAAKKSDAKKSASTATAARKSAPKKSATRRSTPKKPAAKASVPKKAASGKSAVTAGSKSRSAGSGPVVEQIDAIIDAGGDGSISFAGGATLDVSSLNKVFFPKDGITKGDLMRYYARVAPLILPAIEDRPLVLKRFPNGIDKQSFYQQNASPSSPDEVRVETILSEAGEEQQRYVGGDLLTLLHTVQLGAVSVDPWHARVQSLDTPDYTIIDLDPGEKTTFQRVVDVARWAKDEIDALGLRAAIKTSGSRGLHIYIPLPAEIPGDAALLIAQVVASRVAERHPKEATVERSVKKRASGTVYVDYLQNIRAKTVAGVYCVRAKPGATVSTPLEWDELGADLDPRDFTIETAPERFAERGDIWKKALQRASSLKKVLASANR
jgi:bifunctional non-homologous end joining protein LigD